MNEGISRSPARAQAFSPFFYQAMPIRRFGEVKKWIQ
jgi:Ulp1 family protease